MEENGIDNPRQYFTKWDKAEEEVNYVLHHVLTSSVILLLFPIEKLYRI